MTSSATAHQSRECRAEGDTFLMECFPMPRAGEHVRVSGYNPYRSWPQRRETQDDSEDHVPATILRIVRGWIHIGATNGSVQRRRPRLASDPELTYPRANFRYAGFAYRCAQKPSLFVASSVPISIPILLSRWCEKVSMRNRLGKLGWIAAVAMLWLLPARVMGQSQATTGVVEGSVASGEGKTLAGATVILRNLGTNVTVRPNLAELPARA
jgi:hypothetical protein